MMGDKLEDVLHHGVDPELIRHAYGQAAGNEIETGKFFSPESSSVLVANCFGWFLDKPELVPPLPDWNGEWVPQTVGIEQELRFPWHAGRHPWLDAVIETSTAVIAIESKRFEPFRSHKPAAFAETYSQDVWGQNMGGFCAMRDCLTADPKLFQRLDGAQLVKHAFGLRTQMHARPNWQGKRAVLLYLYFEPALMQGRPVSASNIDQHRNEVRDFADVVFGDEIEFQSLTYDRLLHHWGDQGGHQVTNHAAEVRDSLN